MFKDEYRRSFDNISPSAELLDRISAIMSEEAAKKKPPIRMQAVKYGGIAAALVIAAGGTFAVTQMNRSDIKTESANYAAVIPDEADEADGAVGAAGDLSGADGYGMDGVYADSEDKGFYMPENSFMINAEDARFGDAPVTTAAATAAEETRAAETTNAVTTTGIFAIAGGTEQNEAEELADEDSFFVNAADAVSGYEYSGDDSDDDVNPTMGSPEVAAVESADAAAGMFVTDAFLDPFEYSFTFIPDELKRVGGCINDDGSYSERWTEYVYGISGMSVPTDDEDAEPIAAGEAPVEAESFGDRINVRSFISWFNISADDARRALVSDGRLTEEQINAVLTADTDTVTAMFASPCAIAKGDNVYTPLWLLRHSFDDYSAAGITKDDILAKYDLLTTMSDRYSDAVIDDETQKALIEKLDEFLSAQ